MPQLIRQQSAVHGAPLVDLEHTFRELRGEPDHPGFRNAAEAEVSVQMAIMAAEDVVGHMGVPQNSKPVAKTVSELGFNPYREGTMCHAIYAAIEQQQPIAPRAPKGPDAPKPVPVPRQVIHAVRATFAGTSKPQPGSTRNAVLTFVQESPKNTATIADLEAHFKQPVRGYLQKLIERGHLVVLGPEAAQAEAAQ